MAPSHIRVAQPEATSLRDKSRLGDLSIEILQHIFTFVDPISLGRLIRVNRSFRSLIDPAVSLPQASGQVKHLTIRSQDLIWTISRKTFIQGFPKPMNAMNEIEMWRLALGRRCQYCNRKARQGEPSLPRLSPWNAGPGMENVRTIWPFRVRCCGKCLEPRLIKETDLLISGSSALLPGLPFAIFTPSLDYVPSLTLRQMSPPSGLQLTKFYFKPQLEELQRRRDSTRAFGIAALEEWYKGLEDSGQQHNASATRFDQWELQGPLWKTFPHEPKNTSDNAFFSPGINTNQVERVLPPQFTQQDDLPILSLDDNSPGSLNMGSVRYGK
ncbi:hypothetical protein A1O3_03901 [Capronia epimyces CBS 606.96]|uniref:F-box domain-containing protein n=1 Tax=Capronia epimyces CBS 606.96 TaxID=1182542 RepID=W9Y2C4_9EURO|nr:uncharacterized protein A1O3_03901 [Capronia epimyces CBS 606.96]EXJ86947.1 hypothetical protein A1O3_03901 [Capronia epimyces CBS 606.96]